MVFTFGNTQFIALISALIGAIFTVGGVLWRYMNKNLDDKFSDIRAALSNTSEDTSKAIAKVAEMEKDMLRMQLEFNRNYVHRDDYIRGQSTIEAKLDALASKLEVVQIKNAQGDSRG